MERRLAAILAADVVGYTALMGADEIGTLRRLTDLRRVVLEPLIEAHRGRVIKLIGDGLLVEFGSVVDAVTCSVAWQNNVAAREAQSGESKPLIFRIGINLGDVIVEDDDIHGDGVNIATRLEQLSDPGGICISDIVHQSVKTKLDLSFQDLGLQQIKNVADPIRIYRVLGSPADAPQVVSGKRTWHRPAFGVGVVVLAILVGLTVWQRPWQAKIEPSSTERTVVRLSEKPAIAVLPFVNKSGDVKQEHFADGITEDLITDLSKVSALFVIARNSAFFYKGKAVKVQEVAEELGVRYVLEGSVRRSGHTVRINAQLIDTLTGGHLWADRYDGSLSDVFALQDKVTGNIVTALAVRLSPSEKLKLSVRGTDNHESYDAYLLGLRYLNTVKTGRPKAEGQARQAFEKAIALDPNFAAAQAGLAWTIWFQADWEDIQQKSKAYDLAAKSLVLSDNPLAHRLLARQHLDMSYGTPSDQHADAVREMRSAVALEPNNADSVAELANYLVFAGDPEEAASLVRNAKRLNPNFPNWYHRPAGIAAYLLGQYEIAVTDLKQWFDDDPWPFHSAFWLAAANAQMGKYAEATAALTTASRSAVKRGDSIATLHQISKNFPFKNPQHLDSLLDGLVKAGLRDTR